MICSIKPGMKPFNNRSKCTGIAIILSLLVPFISSAQRTCTGSANCTACKNCRYCKHCNSGGTCGVCKPAQKTTSAKRQRAVKDYIVFSKSEPDDDNINSYDVAVSDLEKHAYLSEMWSLIGKIVTLNKIDTNANRTVRIYLYVKPSDGYYCYFEKVPSRESSIEY